MKEGFKVNCAYFKQGFNHKFKCKLSDKEIILSECRNCASREQKPPKEGNYANSNKCLSKGLKTYSKLVAKKEYKYTPKKDKNNNSIMPPNIWYSNTKIKGFHKHHCIGGRNRPNSEKYGLFVWLLPLEHDHSNTDMLNKLKILAQKQWELNYGNREEFIKIFGESFIK